MKTGCIIRPEVRAYHASLADTAILQQPAYSRGVGVTRYGGNNDKFGTCAIVTAIMAAVTKTWRDSGSLIVPDHDLDLQIYEPVTGFDPAQTDANGNNPTDKGTDPEGQLFPWWRENAILGYKLGSFISINPKNVNAIKNSINALGVFLCSDLANSQIGAKDWHSAPPDDEGHATWMDGYIANRVDGTSWGAALEADDDMIASQGAAAYLLNLTRA